MRWVVSIMGTALSPEWDRGFDQAFAELVSMDPDLMRSEFDDLISDVWSQSPEVTSPGPPSNTAPS